MSKPKLLLSFSPPFLWILALLSLALTCAFSLSSRGFVSLPFQFSALYFVILSLALSYPLVLSALRFFRSGEGYEALIAISIFVAAEWGFWGDFRSFELAAWVLSFGMLRLSIVQFIEIRLKEASPEGLTIERGPFLKKGRLYSSLGSVKFIGLALLAYYLWSSKLERPDLALPSALAVAAVAVPALFFFVAYYHEALFRLRSKRLGALIHDQESLDKMSEVTHIAFDKTGTLSLGKPKLSLIKSIENISNKDCLQLAASSEKDLDHPIAKALLAEAQQQNLALLEIADREFVKAKGVRLKIKKQNKELSVLFGNLVWLFENGVESTDVPDELRWEAEGSEDSVLWLAVDQKPMAILTLNDPLKDDANALVRALEDQKYEVGLITSDSETVARAVAKKLKLKFFHFEISPQEKALVIRRLSEKKKKGLDFIFPKVLYVGQAHNEGPAIKEAHMSLHLGSEPAENASLSLQSNELSHVGELLSLMRSIQSSRSLWWNVVYVYHALALILASGILAYFFGFQISALAGASLSFAVSLAVLMPLWRSVKSS